MESVKTRLVKSAGSRYSRAHRQTFYWTVNPRVIVGSIVDQLNVEGNAVSLAVTASEPGATLTFSATGLFIDPASGVISGTISESALTTVPYAVTATVATFTNSDPNWSAWQFSATINWGDGTTSDAGAISGGNGAFTVSGNHVYARAGNYTTSVAIADGFQTVTSAGTVAVSAAPIVVTGGFVQGAAAGIEVSATLASFTGNASALASGFTATINWGDTTSGVGTITGVNGKFVVNGRHTYASTGTYTVTVSITDADASTGSATSTIQVGDVLAGIPATLTVATFRSNDSNATASQFSATIVWGDGTSSNTSDSPTTVTITALAGGVYNVQGTHKYAADGAYTVTTTVYGPYSESITASRSVTAKAPALTGYAENIAATPGVAFSNVAVAEFIDPNQADASGAFTATINWGDGTSSTGTVSGANGVFEVKGGHTYATAGNYAIQVEVQQAWSAFANVLYLTAFAVAQKQPEKTTSFYDIVEANFNSWSDGKNGITQERIQKLIADPSIKGKDAAALVALYKTAPGLLAYFNGKANVGVTLAIIKSAKTEYGRFPDPTDRKIVLAYEVQDTFEQIKKKIEGTSRDVLDGKPDGNAGAKKGLWLISARRTPEAFASVKQGTADDCVLLASVISMLHVSAKALGGPGTIAISKNGDGYLVGFDGNDRKTEIEVKAPTDSQIALYSSANGIWSLLVEAAFAKGYEASKTWWNPKLNWFNQPKNVFERLDGKVSGEVTKWLTNKGQKLYYTKDTTAAKIVEELTKVTNTTAKTDAKGFHPLTALVIVGSNPNPTWETLPFDKRKDVLTPTHAYAVIGYNPDKLTIEIQNPWGDPAYKYGTTFEMPIDQFMKLFRRISIGEPQ